MEREFEVDQPRPIGICGCPRVANGPFQGLGDHSTERIRQNEVGTDIRNARETSSSVAKEPLKIGII